MDHQPRLARDSLIEAMLEEPTLPPALRNMATIDHLLAPDDVGLPHPILVISEAWAVATGVVHALHFLHGYPCDVPVRVVALEANASGLWHGETKKLITVALPKPTYYAGGGLRDDIHRALVPAGSFEDSAAYVPPFLAAVDYVRLATVHEIAHLLTDHDDVENFAVMEIELRMALALTTPILVRRAAEVAWGTAAWRDS
jgi:hypothetical protein